MPGIVGIVSQEAPDFCETMLRNMLASLQHESMCMTGSMAFPELGIYAGSVSLPGTFPTAHCEPIRRGDLALFFSGEIFDELRNGLSGIASHQRLLEQYEQNGAQFIEDLNGLFSGLLVDSRRQQAFLFNDRFGMERLYACEHSGSTYFASEAKAILRVVPSTRAFDPAGVAQYFALGCTTSSQTLFRGVSLLPGGSRWRFDRGVAPNKSRYFVPETWERQSTLAPAEFDEEFSSIFRRILPQYFNSDLKIGVSLTGGLDTRMIMACLPRGIPDPICYTFDTEGQESLDAAIAERIAQLRGLVHRTLRLDREFFANFTSYLERTVYATDGCAGAMTSHEIPLNALARELAPVRVTGNFGSEVLRAVSTFKPLRLDPELLSAEYRARVEAAAEQAPNAAAHPVTFSAFREIPWKLFGTFAAARSQITFRTPFLDNAIVALAYRAPSSLRLSPLPALRLIEANDHGLAAIPTDRGLLCGTRGFKQAVRRVFAEVTCKLDYLHAEGLPHALSPVDGLVSGVGSTLGLFGRHKFLRYRSWFRNELASPVQAVLNDPRTLNLPFWDSAMLPRLASDHLVARKNYVREINAVLQLATIDRVFFKEGPPAD